MKTHNSHSINPCCIKFTPTDAVCITVEWLTDQSMVRALSHSKHEILPGSSMWNVNCTHFHSTALACHFLHLSDLPYTLYSVRAATYLSQCSWTGTAVCWQIQQQFYNNACCNSSTRADCSPTCSRPVGATADKLTHTYTPTHADTHTHNRGKRPRTCPPHQRNPVKCWASQGQDEIEIMFTVHVILSQVQCICPSVWW